MGPCAQVRRRCCLKAYRPIQTVADSGEITEKHHVDILYTAPTAIRSLMAAGPEFPDAHPMSSLKVLGTVENPSMPEAWHWYDQHVGKGRVPIVDTWWQTETGGIMISNLAGVTEAKPTYATRPLPGIQPLLVDEQGLKSRAMGFRAIYAFASPGQA